MIEGYPIKVWRELPVQERAALFGENSWEYALRNLRDPEELVRFDQIIRLTTDIYTGKLTLEERVVAQAKIDELRQAMLDNPDKEVGRVADLYAWIGALHFGNEIQNGIPTLERGIEAPRSNTWYEVKRGYDPKKMRGSYRLIPHEVVGSSYCR